MEETSDNQDTPFDRLEARIDALIQRYETLQGEHNRCGEELAAKEVRIRELEATRQEQEFVVAEQDLYRRATELAAQSLHKKDPDRWKHFIPAWKGMVDQYYTALQEEAHDA